MDPDTAVLVRYRLEQADEALKATRMLLDGNLPRVAVGRAYYAMFYAVLALLASRQQGTSKHAAVLSLFDLEFVKTGMLSPHFSQWLHEAFDLRQRADYREMFTVSPERAAEVAREAEQFVAAVKQHLAL